MSFGLHHQALFLGHGQRLDALTLDLGLLQYRRNEFLLATIDLGFLHLDLAFFLHLLHPHAFGDHLLLHDVCLDVVRLVSLRLLLLGNFEVLRFLDLQIALRLGLLGLRQRFGQYPFLVGLRLRNRSFASRGGPLDGSVSLRFHRSHVRVALDARYVRLAHVGDVLVLVAHFLDGERNHFQPHLAHVISAGGAHTLAYHLGLLHDFFHRELSDDAAQMAFHHQSDQSLALLICLGQELLRRGQDRLDVGLDLDLRHGLDCYRLSLLGVEILLRSHVERHQFQRKLPANLHHGPYDGPVTFHDTRAAEAVNDERFMRTGLAIESRESAHQEQNSQDAQPDDDPDFCWYPERHIASSHNSNRTVRP